MSSIDNRPPAGQVTCDSVHLRIWPHDEDRDGPGRGWWVCCSLGEHNHNERITNPEVPHVIPAYVERFARGAGVDARDLDGLGWRIFNEIELQTPPIVPPSGNGSAAPGQPQREPPGFTRLISVAELLTRDVRLEYLVRGVLVRGQPAVIGGRSKTLKTSIGCDLAVSIASGTDFLGNENFRTNRAKVAFWSGESGEFTIRETMRRIIHFKTGLDPADCDLHLNFETPKLSRADHLVALEETIREQAIQVAVIDPLYLALLSPENAGMAGNIYAMGAALQPVGEIGQRTGCTMIVLHHFKKSAGSDDDGAPLEDLAQSGIAEWARQWLLLRRRTAYTNDGNHELYLWAGGSAGHAGQYAVDIDEGLPDPDTLYGRHWDVAVRSVTEARQDAQREREQRNEQRRSERHQTLLNSILEAFNHYPDGTSQTQIRQHIGNPRDFGEAWRLAVSDGNLEPCRFRAGNNREYDGWRRVYRDGDTNEF